MATLKDVADRAGVSIATVSYYINGTHRLREDTRQRVMQAIRELNYIPNRAARNLKESENKEIGIVLPDIEDPYYSEILKGLVYEAETAGYTLNIAFTYWLPTQECRIIEEFISRNVSGIIILTCQPSNTEFFQDSIIAHQVPNVFIDRIPKGLNVNFQTFDNYTAVHYLTEQLLLKGYERIGLMIGSEEQLGESDSFYAFTDAFIKCKKEFDPDLIYHCNMTKEDAFRVLMNALRTQDAPQAIITSSENIMKGVVEALVLLHIRIPEDICVITLGIECWNRSNYNPRVLHTSRRAYTMGRHCSRLLISNIRSPQMFETEFMLHQDHHLTESMSFPDPPKPFYFERKKETLKILSLDLPTIRALSAMAQVFSNQYDAQIEVDYLPMRELFERVCEDSVREQSEYDIYVVDVSWMRYLVQENCLMDLTDLLQTQPLFSSHIMLKNLENCRLNDRYYALPIIGGTHLLFYRRDYFTDTELQKEFRAKHRLSLRPPKTWTEFNGIARYFTREFNPSSPSLYGTALPAKMSEELALDILIRLWSAGGGLYDQSGRLILNTPQNVRGFQNILETCACVPPDILELDHHEAFRDFAEGKISMLVSFTEYAGAIKNYIPSDLMPNVGYCMMPGGTPANVGWQLGVSRSTKKFDLIRHLFDWVCQKNTSYYLTILDGQAVMKYPYENHELLKLYPWLDLTEESIRISRSRIYPSKGRKTTVPPWQVETVLCNIFQKIWEQGLSIPQALREGDREMKRLFS